MEVKLGVSNRHLHLCQKDVDCLFGEGYLLTRKRDLVQPGQFACEETVTIQTDKNKMDRVRIIGPTRPYTQVEISQTDAYWLGIHPPIRSSGDIEGSEGITLIGPKGKVILEQGCIIANRHIHLTPKDVLDYHLEGIEKVGIFVKGPKGGLLYDVDLKVSEQHTLELHLDIDDVNAFLLQTGDVLEVIMDESI